MLLSCCDVCFAILLSFSHKKQFDFDVNIDNICFYYFYIASDGSAVFDVDLPKPELLPCGYIVGDVNSISVELKGITCFVCLY